ncbi:MAG: class I adenylate-forming enzyme family protein [Caulobacterales bacterium]
MARRIFDQALKTPHKPAILYNHTSISYREFARRIEGARRYLAGQHLKRRGVAVLCVANTVDAWVLALALRDLGLTTVAAQGPHLIGPMRLRDVVCIVASGAEDLAGLPDGREMRLIRAPIDVLTGASAGRADALPPAKVPGGHMVVTSGTTGAMKKVLVDAASEPGHLAQRIAAFGVTPDTVFNILNWGIWTSIGHMIPTIMWGLGGTVVIRQPAPHAGAPQGPDFTHAIATPTMLSEILADPAQAPWPGSPRLFAGGGAVPADLAAEVLRRLTPNLFHIVASTEAGVWCVTPIERPEDVASHRPVPGRVVEVVDEAGRPLPAGEAGLIRVDILPGVDAYHQDPEATRAWFRDGFFYSGDLGRFDAGGRLTIQGRVSDVVVVGEHKIAAETVEAAVENWFPGRTAGVFSTPAQGAGEELHVVFEGARPEEPDLRALVAAELPRFPRVHFHVIEALPRNDRGKLQRFILKQRILADWKRGDSHAAPA